MGRTQVPIRRQGGERVYPHLSPLVTLSLFSVSVSLFLFCKQVHLCHFLKTRCHRELCSVVKTLHLQCRCAQVPSLVREVRSHKLHGMAKKRKRN